MGLFVQSAWPRKIEENVATLTTAHCSGRTDWPAPCVNGSCIPPEFAGRSIPFSYSELETESWYTGLYLYDRADSIIDVVATYCNVKLSSS